MLGTESVEAAFACKADRFFDGALPKSVTLTVQSMRNGGYLPTSAQAHESYGYGSKLNHLELEGFSADSHLPGFHFGYLLLTHSHISICVYSWSRSKHDTCKPARCISPGDVPQ